MATRYTSLGTAALIAGSIGASVYTASTAQSAREAISAAHDPPPDTARSRCAWTRAART